MLMHIIRVDIMTSLSLMTMKEIRRGAYQSVTHLKAGIQQFINAHQANPKPFVWTKSADEILANICAFLSRPSTRGPPKRCHEPLGQDTRSAINKSGITA
jgi:hypothetical protein